VYQTVSSNVGGPKSSSTFSQAVATDQGTTAGNPAPSPTFPFKPGTMRTRWKKPFITGLTATHCEVPTSSGWSPAGSGGWTRPKNFPRIVVLNGIQSNENNEIGDTLAWKNGEEAPGWVTEKFVVPFDSVLMSKFATCSGGQLQRTRKW
jgi:hypothetical protein